MADCVEVIRDSIDELQQSIGELGHISSSNFSLSMSDVQTWISAALMDEDTCMDAFEGNNMNGYAKTAVRKRIVKIAHLTSNALALVDNYDSTQGYYLP
ncbi:structural maintenance of chromosomes protein 2-2-like isoform 1 [Hibiscus syriacus]|uniref:Structural maintenance of chromosomes protein 2-2-like isoform 1 n=3 Tax=Hibiscus syriacus TaxID=106335 RepID=A0A6A3CB28_HIBSY|nr:structural maintenance of chromosomes protein 2-2-like isoform 1 [Hibiscus syriacus]